MWWLSMMPQTETKVKKARRNLDLEVIRRREKGTNESGRKPCSSSVSQWMDVFKTPGPIWPLTNTSSRASYIVAPFACALACSCFPKNFLLSFHSPVSPIVPACE